MPNKIDDMLSKKTYTMEYTCSNCGHSFFREIQMGKNAVYSGGTCSYCGRQDGWINPFRYRKPSDIIKGRPGANYD